MPISALETLNPGQELVAPLLPDTIELVDNGIAAIRRLAGRENQMGAKLSVQFSGWYASRP